MKRYQNQQSIMKGMNCTRTSEFSARQINRTRKPKGGRTRQRNIISVNTNIDRGIDQRKAKGRKTRKPEKKSKNGYWNGKDERKSK